MDNSPKSISTLKWQDISILTDNNNRPILILLFPDQQEANNMYQILTKNAFNLEVYMDKSTGTHDLKIPLTDTEYGIGLKSPLTLDKYPPLKLLHNKQVLGITCGFNSNGQLLFNQNIIPLDGNQVILN